LIDGRAKPGENGLLFFAFSLAAFAALRCHEPVPDHWLNRATRICRMKTIDA
jgi:hypothetical protein